MRRGFRRGTGYSVKVAPALVLGLIAGFLAIMAVIFWFVAQSLDATARRLAEGGQEIEAVITDKRIVEREEVDNDGDRRRSTNHYLTVSFTPPSGETVVADELVGQPRYDAAQIGQKVTLFYLPEEPTLFEFERGDKASDAGVFRWISIGLGGVGIAVALGAFLLRGRPAAA